jgi:hypothetical protein
VRAHLESVYKQTGKKPKQLQDEVKLPVWADDLWGLFITLCGYRGWMDGKPRPIKPSEVKAHCELNSISLNRIEYRLLVDLDQEYLKNG